MNINRILSAVAHRIVPTVLMLALLASSFGAPVIAQTNDPAPAVIETETETVETIKVDTTDPADEPKDEVTDPDAVTTPSEPQVQSLQVEEDTDEPELPPGAERISDEDLLILDSDAQSPAFFFGDPTLVIEKELIQDNGGTELYGDFSVTVKKYQRFLIIFWIPDGTSTHSFDSNGEIEFEADKGHRYVITEDDADGYTTTYSDEDDKCDFTFPLFGSPTYTCTITNDDIAPSLTLVKEVDNSEGGTAVAADWNLSATGPTSISGAGGAASDDTFQAGVYTLAETGNILGYTPGLWECDGGSLTGDSLTIGIGEEVECTIENTFSLEPQMCTLVSDDVDTYVGFVPADEVNPHQNWTKAFLGDNAKWVWQDDDDDGVVTFTRSFMSSSDTTGTLEVAADNTYSVTVNGDPVSCDGSGTANFGSPESCPITVDSGENTIEFTVTNAGGVANPGAGNPAGLYYKVTVQNAVCSENPPVPTATVTMCKVDTEQNPLANWTLMLLGNPVGSTNVQPDGNDYSIANVPSGDYVLQANGFYTYRGTPGAEYSDAAYSKRDPGDPVYGGAYAPWVRVNDFPNPNTGWLGIMLNGGFTDWGSIFNPAHQYAHGTSTDATMDFTFNILDDNYGDNTGNLVVNVNEGFMGVTGQDGCVTFTDVPYGTYTADEILQDGWSTVSGTGAVEVDDPTETFTIVNEEEGQPGQCVINSDSTTLEGGSASFENDGPFHPSWTAVVDALAKWIWGDDGIVDPVGETTQTFTKTFDLDNAPTSATLKIAADNSYVVELNGVEIASSTDEDNYTAAGEDTISIPAGSFNVGGNTLEITVKNHAMAGGTTESNPAGLRYHLTIDGTDCTETTPPLGLIKVHIYKYLSDDGIETQVADGSGETPFPMTSSWDASNIGAGSGSYVLGNGHGGASFQYAADTSPMQAPADYTTSETTDGSVVVPIGGECSPGKYRLLGYREGTSLAAAELAPLSPTPPNYVDITSDRYIIVVNEDCDEVDDSSGPTPISDYIVVEDADLADNFGDVASDITRWFFYNDETDVIDSALGTFVDGPDSAPLGEGSAQMTVSGTQRRNIATYQFKNVELADIDELTFSTYSQSAGNGSPASERAPYLHFNVDFDNSDTWQNRLVFVPSENGVVVNDTWQEWDAIDGGSALWTWSGFDANGGKWLDGNTNRYRTWSDILATWPNIQTLATDSWFGFRVGEPYADGFTGNVDAFIIRINDGVTDVTTTFDFEPTDPGPTGGGVGTFVTGNSADPRDNDEQVLGATTDGMVLGATCPLLTDFMREGLANNPEQVTALQNFLNGELGIALATNGVFDMLTTLAVNAFQLKYQPEVLAPWGPFGYDPMKPTGYVYKTTLWKVNDIACPDLDVPFPALP